MPSSRMALFGSFWLFLAPFGTLFCGGAWKMADKLEDRSWKTRNAELGTGDEATSECGLWISDCVLLSAWATYELETRNRRLGRSLAPPGLGFSLVCFVGWRFG
jgi:hypothetical protein